MGAPRAAAQTGSIEFVVRATPSGGVEEPVRGFPVFLLRKSFAEIRKEVDLAHPKPDMNAFIEQLEVSKELKAWMKKNHWVALSGEDFLKKLTEDDVMGVPEFFSAYVERNAGDKSVAFPSPKYKPTDKVKDPVKHQKLVAEYHAAIRQFFKQNPQSTEGMDLSLEDVNPGHKWQEIEERRNSEFHRDVLELAETRYLVARTETDLQGQGFLRGIPPGTYWLSTLDVAADVGDARPRWDTAVGVRAGEVTRISLSNVNAVPPTRSSL